MRRLKSISQFHEEYDQVTREVEQSREQFVADHIENWFALIDETTEAAQYFKLLERAVFIEFMSFISKVKQAPSVSGHTKGLSWPVGPERRLGMQLLTFREIAERRIAIGDFADRFLTKGNIGRRPADAVIADVFMPMARELRRRLDGEFAHPSAFVVPAADRTVKLDHNSAPYQEAIDALDGLEKALHEANDYPDSEDKEEKIAEVSAARRLLQSARVRVGALVALIGTGLTYLATHFVGTAIDTASHTVIDKLTTLLGPYF